MVAAFKEEYLQSLQKVEAALKSNDSNLLAAYAHKLKGGAALFGESSAYQIASSLEELAMQQKAAECAGLYDELVAAFSDLDTSITKLAEKGFS